MSPAGTRCRLRGAGLHAVHDVVALADRGRRMPAGVPDFRSTHGWPGWPTKLARKRGWAMGVRSFGFLTCCQLFGGGGLQPCRGQKRCTRLARSHKNPAQQAPACGDEHFLVAAKELRHHADTNGPLAPFAPVRRQLVRRAHRGRRPESGRRPRRRHAAGAGHGAPAGRRTRRSAPPATPSSCTRRRASWTSTWRSTGSGAGRRPCRRP